MNIQSTIKLSTTNYDIASCSFHQTHLNESPKWPIALNAFLNIEVLTCIRFIARVVFIKLKLLQKTMSQ